MERLKFRMSAAQRVALCPGSVKASIGIGEGKTSPEAERGTRIHAALADYFSHGPATKDGISKMLTTPEEADTAVVMAEMTEKLIGELGGIDGKPLCEAEVEAAGWTGHIDLMAMLNGGDLLVIDWKTGRGAVADSDENAQLRAYAVGAIRKATDLGWCYGGQVTVAIIQPFEKTVPCFYSIGDIAVAGQELVAWRAGAEADTAPRVPSPDACKYCPAKATSRCPETTNLPATLAESAPLVDLRTMPGAKLAGLIAAGEIVAKLLDEAKDAARDRLKAGEEVGDLALGKPRKTRSIADNLAALQRLADKGVNQKAIFGFCKVSIPEIEKAMGKADAAEAIGDLIVEKEGEAPLVRRKVA